MGRFPSCAAYKFLILRDDGEGDRDSLECRASAGCEGGQREQRVNTYRNSSIYCRDLTCKRGSVGQSEGLSIPRSSVRFRLKPDTSNSHEFELHIPSNKGTKLLLKVIKAIIIIIMNFSFKPLFAIWSSSPQRFHYYFFPSIVSWQYQKYSTILILVLCLLCVTPLVCSSYSSFAPSSPFFSS